MQEDGNCTRMGKDRKEIQGRFRGKAGKAWEEMTGKGAAEQNLVLPLFRPKTIIPPEVAEVG